MNHCLFWLVAIGISGSAFARTLTDKIAASYKVKSTDIWQGGQRTIFDFNGYDAWVVEPPAEVKAAEGRPWTWTMQWRDAFVPRTGVPQLLKAGFHHVSIDTFQHRMDEKGLEISKAFQTFLVEKLGFAKKANLIGMSWGGFFSVRYAANFPENVAKIYLDCPLMNLSGFCDGDLSARRIGPWADFKLRDWRDDPRMPVNMAKPLADAKIPVLLAYGGADNVLDPKLNAEMFIPRFKAAGGTIEVVYRGMYGHHPHGFEINESKIADFFSVNGETPTTGRPKPRQVQLERIRDGVEIYGIVHWGLNTFTDREWGYGDENPQDLNPEAFDAEQIVKACKDGGLQGLVVVAKHHDGFCLWPTKTTGHNITKSPFRGGKGDYVKEMEEACRKHGLRFGVYVSPWDRNNAAYASPAYVETFHAQVKELLSGGYGEIFEMWFDGANGGDGYYGGAREKRKIGEGYYRFPEVYEFVRTMQPKVAIFAGESDSSDFRWPGNECGMLDSDSRASIESVGGFCAGKYGNPRYKGMINLGSVDGPYFRICEADFPLRPGWFYHERERGQTKSAAYLMQRYLDTVGNGGTMNLGIAPDRRGQLDGEDVKALKGFGELKQVFFSKEVSDGQPFNIVVLKEDVANGELVDAWRLEGDGRILARGVSVGIKRIRTFAEPVQVKKLVLKATSETGHKPSVSLRRYFVDPELLKLVMTATTESGETDTALWMTGAKSRGK